VRVWSTIANIFGIFFLGFYLITFYNLAKLNDKQFEELRLRYVVNYATEAAFLSSLEVYDIGIEYQDLEGVNIDPSYCLDIFKAMVCLNYDMSLSDENFSMLENYIPVAVLMANDGYYVTSMVEVDDIYDNLPGSNYALKLSMKKPYTIKLDEDAPVSQSNPLYAFDLHSENWTSAFSVNGKLQISNGESFPTGINRNTVTRAVTTRITEEINYAIKQRNELYNDNLSTLFYLPSSLTYSGINTLDKPAMLIMMQNVDFACSERINAVSLGGVKVDRKRNVVGFVENNRRYYCYETQLPQTAVNSVVDFYNDVEDAAEAGFYPHFVYLKEPAREGK
jgi:hypothetical protein